IPAAVAALSLGEPVQRRGDRGFGRGGCAEGLSRFEPVGRHACGQWAGYFEPITEPARGGGRRDGDELMLFGWRRFGCGCLISGQRLLGRTFARGGIWLADGSSRG